MAIDLFPGRHRIPKEELISEVWFPRVGMRVVKTIVAVFLCFLIYLLRGRQGVPFYSAIAAILCMQPDVSNSLKVAVNRTVGTLIGGGVGMLALLIELRFFPDSDSIYKYAFVSLMILPLIYLTLVVKKPTASYITCVVFLSITVSHITDPNPYLFALNRILDTLIGIFVSLGVNAVRLPRRKDQNLLILLDLEKCFGSYPEAISSYEKFRLNQLIAQGAKITFFTRKGPGEFLPILQGISLPLPVLCLDGAALYSVRDRKYQDISSISPENVQKILQLFQCQGIRCFSASVIRDVLYVYCGSDPEAFPDGVRNTPEQLWICEDPPSEKPAVCITANVSVGEMDRLTKELSDQMENTVRMTLIPDFRTNTAQIELVGNDSGLDRGIARLMETTGLERKIRFFGLEERDLLKQVAKCFYHKPE